jgi:hypothetical protein
MVRDSFSLLSTIEIALAMDLLSACSRPFIIPDASTDTIQLNLNLILFWILLSCGYQEQKVMSNRKHTNREL